ncbi:SMP-30/gluconolactonase/LRE family protein [Leptospira sp. GIMC2001]|uniref:SMP-30/gluconolactonase/LRE family protein n=1 Tax=Leptospira sp. GIMC2001 TaxID=1513297 RepID=UPI002349F07D|nr:hypothetical protein [Leptospira sp. GIMC2001]WCL49610.1 hypothetical protein O4O04_01985 [Leptospira sp. GIMC2001]
MNYHKLSFRIFEYLFFCILLLNCLSFPEEHFRNQIQDPEIFPINEDIEKVRDPNDLQFQGLQKIIPNLPAQDEILLQEDLDRAFVAAMDGYIWIVDLKNLTAEPYVRTPLLAGGMVQHPKNRDLIYFCVSRAKKDDIIEPNGPGIYELTISTKSIRKIGTRVPKKIDQTYVKTKSKIGNFYPNKDQTNLFFKDMNDTNSRAVEKADDLAISSDGERIYFTEPYDHSGAILGVSSQSQNEVLTLGKNGHLWKYDLANNSASLVADNYTYLDGILLEQESSEAKESSILLNELSKFRLIRLYLSGPRAGEDELVIEGLPGFPDGMDRDSQGRIWIAMPVQRSGLINWLHEHPFWKGLALYIPSNLKPVSKKTSLLILSKDGKTPLYYGVHDGSVFSVIIVVVPGKEKVYLSIYHNGYEGLNTMNYPIPD